MCQRVYVSMCVQTTFQAFNHNDSSIVENLHVDVEQGKGLIMHNVNFGPGNHV